MPTANRKAKETQKRLEREHKRYAAVVQKTPGEIEQHVARTFAVNKHSVQPLGIETANAMRKLGISVETPSKPAWLDAQGHRIHERNMPESVLGLFLSPGAK